MEKKFNPLAKDWLMGKAGDNSKDESEDESKEEQPETTEVEESDESD